MLSGILWIKKDADVGTSNVSARRRDPLVDEDLERGASLFDETLFVNAVIRTKGKLPFQGLAWQGGHHDLWNEDDT